MTEAPVLTSQQLIRLKAAGEPLAPDQEPMVHRHVITLLLENSIGALNRVINMFSARGFNLESVSVGETDTPEVSRLTVVTTGNDRIIAQVMRQLTNLVDTLMVDDVTGTAHVERELCLIQVKYTPESRPALMDIVSIFRGNVINITPETMTFEVTGPTTKVAAFVGMMKPHGITEIARSGRVAMRRELAFGD
jgi:acetolactate synthase-1/3 small subunit